MERRGLITLLGGIPKMMRWAAVYRGIRARTGFQSDFQGFLLNPHICLRRAGVHSGGSKRLQQSYRIGAIH
jgi:hypothetical protein